MPTGKRSRMPPATHGRGPIPVSNQVLDDAPKGTPQHNAAGVSPRPGHCQLPGCAIAAAAFVDRGGCSAPRARMASAIVSTGAFALTAAETRRARAVAASQPQSSISTPTAVSTCIHASNGRSGSQTKVTIHHTRVRPLTPGYRCRLSKPRRRGGFRLRGLTPATTQAQDAVAT
jgi:hypothetical protein